MVSILPYTERAVLNSGFFISSIVSFALLWSATAVLLHHYVSKFGRLRFWAIIASPLILFLGQFASYFGAVLDPLLSLDPVSYTMFVTLVFTLSKPIGGVLFGIAFFTLARNVRQNAALRNYLIISALGFVLLYVSNQASGTGCYAISRFWSTDSSIYGVGIILHLPWDLLFSDSDI